MATRLEQLRALRSESDLEPSLEEAKVPSDRLSQLQALRGGVPTPEPVEETPTQPRTFTDPAEDLGQSLFEITGFHGLPDPLDIIGPLGAGVAGFLGSSAATLAQQAFRKGIEPAIRSVTSLLTGEDFSSKLTPEDIKEEGVRVREGVASVLAIEPRTEQAERILSPVNKAFELFRIPFETADKFYSDLGYPNLGLSLGIVGEFAAFKGIHSGASVAKGWVRRTNAKLKKTKSDAKVNDILRKATQEVEESPKLKEELEGIDQNFAEVMRKAPEKGGLIFRDQAEDIRKINAEQKSAVEKQRSIQRVLDKTSKRLRPEVEPEVFEVGKTPLVRETSMERVAREGEDAALILDAEGKGEAAHVLRNEIDTTIMKDLGIQATVETVRAREIKKVVESSNVIPFDKGTQNRVDRVRSAILSEDGSESLAKFDSDMASLDTTGRNKLVRKISRFIDIKDEGIANPPEPLFTFSSIKVRDIPDVVDPRILQTPLKSIEGGKPVTETTPIKNLSEEVELPTFKSTPEAKDAGYELTSRRYKDSKDSTGLEKAQKRLKVVKESKEFEGTEDAVIIKAGKEYRIGRIKESIDKAPTAEQAATRAEAAKSATPAEIQERMRKLGTPDEIAKMSPEELGLIRDDIVDSMRGDPSIPIDPEMGGALQGMLDFVNTKLGLKESFDADVTLSVIRPQSLPATPLPSGNLRIKQSAERVRKRREAKVLSDEVRQTGQESAEDFLARTERKGKAELEQISPEDSVRDAQVEAEPLNLPPAPPRPRVFQEQDGSFTLIDSSRERVGKFKTREKADNALEKLEVDTVLKDAGDIIGNERGSVDISLLRDAVDAAKRKKIPFEEYLKGLSGLTEKDVRQLTKQAKRIEEIVDIGEEMLKDIASFETGPIVNNEGRIKGGRGRVWKDRNGNIISDPPVYQGHLDAIRSNSDLTRGFGAVETAPRKLEQVPVLHEMFMRPHNKMNKQANIMIDAETTRVNSFFEEFTAKEKSRAQRYDMNLNPIGQGILKFMELEPVLNPTPRELRISKFLQEATDTRWENTNNARMGFGLKPVRYLNNYSVYNTVYSFLERYGIKSNPAMEAEAAVAGRINNYKATKYAHVRSRKNTQRNIEMDPQKAYLQFMKSSIKHEVMSPLLSYVNQIRTRMRDPETGQRYILRSEKPELDKFLGQWTSSIANNGTIPGSHPAAEAILGGLSRNISYSILAGTFRSALIQPFALLNSGIEIGHGRVGASAIKLAKGRSSMHQKAFDRSNVLIKNEYETLYTDLIDGVRTGKIIATRDATNQALMVPLSVLDYEARIITHDAAFNHYKKKGASDQRAQDLADDVVIRTQGSSSPGHLSPIQTSAMGRPATALMTFVINNFGFLARDVLGFKGKDVRPTNKLLMKKIFRLIAGTTMFNMIYEDVLHIPSPAGRPIKALIDGIENDDHPARIAMDVTLEIFEPVPGLSSAKYGSNPFGILVDKAGKATGLIRGGIAVPEVGTAEFAIQAAELAGTFAGIGLTGQEAKTRKGLKRGENLWDALTGFYTGGKKASGRGSRSLSRGSRPTPR